MNKKISKSKKLNKTRKFKRTSVMKGGDDRSTGLPSAYHNGTSKGLSGYYESGSSDLKSSGKNYAVSQGTLWPNGSMAGPNLYPTSGGACGCNKKNKNKSMKSNKYKKNNNKRKSKRNNKK
jgi:hypothetical protein